MKNDKSKDVLLQVAQAVADGSRVDWNQEATAIGDLPRQIRSLRAVERIRSVHQSQPHEDAPGGETTENVRAELPPPATWGHLEVHERLGSGSFGTVYRAHDPALKIDVALKLFVPQDWKDRDEEQSYLEEAQKLASIRNPNVLTIHGADRREGSVGIWTEMVEGQTLRHVMQEQGQFSPREATLIGIDLCKALAAVHAKGLVHGDIKPANVMREVGGRIVLMDFGGARRSNPEGVTQRISGTPIYMAPELFLGRDSGQLSDIYSLGILLYELVTGTYPVRVNSHRELFESHRRRDYVPLRDARPDLPSAFIQTVERALAWDPADRMTSAGEMERALQSCLGLAAEHETQNQGISRKVGWSALAVAVLGAAALGLWMALRIPLEVETSIFRLGNGVEERLVEGGRVYPGDQLFLEIEASKDAYVYIVNEDEAGAAYRLFPLDGLDQQNPLPGGAEHRLPGTRDGQAYYWELDSPGGRETILVVASSKRLDDVETKLDQLAQAGTEEGRREATQELIGQLRGLKADRGLGGLTPLADRDSSITAITSQLNTASANADGVWYWEITLVNPTP